MGSVVPLKKSANSAYLELKNHLSKKLQKVEGLIEQKLKSEVNLIKEMSNHHLNSGGKRLRALLKVVSGTVKPPRILVKLLTITVVQPFFGKMVHMRLSHGFLLVSIFTLEIVIITNF